MVTFTTAKNTNRYNPSLAAAVNKKNLPKNPATGGIPASENNANIITKLNLGFVRNNPL